MDFIIIHTSDDVLALSINNIKMKDRGFHMQESSYQTQQIIKLRVELAKSKASILKFEEFNLRNSKYESQMQTLFQIIDKRSSIVNDIASLLRIDCNFSTFPENKNNKNEYQPKWDQSQYFDNLLHKYKQLSGQWGRQQHILKLIHQATKKIVKQNQELKEKMEYLNKAHSQIKEVQVQIAENRQKIQYKQVILQQKQSQINLIKAQKDAFYQKILVCESEKQNLQSKQSEYLSQLNTLRQQLYKLRDSSAQTKQRQLQKQKAIENCKSIEDMLTLNQDDYLKHYFRSNGLPFENVRNHKNKYAIVFDT